VVGTTAAYLGLLLLVALQRLGELVVSRRNAAWVLERGAVEAGGGHYPAMVALHVFLLVGSGLEVVLLHRPFDPVLAVPLCGVLVGAQGVRMWCMKALGRRWTTRVYVIPGAPVVTTGPYRFLRHPNYLAVAAEGLALPLIHGAWITALIFSLGNAWLLAVRIRCEERTLAALASGVEARAERSPLLPKPRALENR
jgi:methyltransferase